MTERAEENGILFKIACGLCGIFVIFSYSLLSFLMRAIPGVEDLDSSTRRIVISGVWLVLAVAAALVLYFTKKQKPLEGFRLLEIRSKKQAYIMPVMTVTAFLGGIGLNRIVTVANSVIPFPDSWVSAHEESVEAVTEGDPIVSVIAVCVLAPLIEELSMRGKGIYYFRKAFGKRAGTAVAVILTSLLFAILHGNIIQGIYAFVCGLLFALLSLRAGSVVPSIFAHIGFNASNLLFYAFLNNPNREYLTLFVNVACVAVFLISAAAVWIMGSFLREKKKRDDAPPHDIYIDR